MEATTMASLSTDASSITTEEKSLKLITMNMDSKKSKINLTKPSCSREEEGTEIESAIEKEKPNEHTPPKSDIGNSKNKFAEDQRREIERSVIEEKPYIVFAQEIRAPSHPRWKLDVPGEYDFRSNPARVGLMWNSKQLVKSETIENEMKEKVLRENRQREEHVVKLVKRSCIIVFREIASSKEMIAISWHGPTKVCTETEPEASNFKERLFVGLQEFALQLVRMRVSSTGRDLPIVIGGDFNFSYSRAAKACQAEFHIAPYVPSDRRLNHKQIDFFLYTHEARGILMKNTKFFTTDRDNYLETLLDHDPIVSTLIFDHKPRNIVIILASKIRPHDVDDRLEKMGVPHMGLNNYPCVVFTEDHGEDHNSPKWQIFESANHKVTVMINRSMVCEIVDERKIDPQWRSTLRECTQVCRMKLKGTKGNILVLSWHGGCADCTSRDEAKLLGNVCQHALHLRDTLQDNEGSKPEVIIGGFTYLSVKQLNVRKFHPTFRVITSVDYDGNGKRRRQIILHTLQLNGVFTLPSPQFAGFF